MSEASFRSKRRQKFLTEKYFNLNVIDIGRSLANAQIVREEDQRSGRVKPSTEGLSFKSQLKLLRLHYTAGEPIESLKPLYAEAVKWFEQWHFAYRAYIAELGRERHEDLRDDGSPCQFEDLFHFQLALDLVSVGVLLGEADLVMQAAALIGRYRHTDMLFEAIVERHVPDPSQTEEFFHEVPYGPLLDAIYTAQTAEAKSAFVKQYLDGWYKAFEGVPWHDGHLVQTEEYSDYEGYWAFEAAAVCVLYDIDDTSFRDHIVYPKDLADWARKHRVIDRIGRADPNDGGDHALRCEAGHPCPRTGWWITPSGASTAGGRRHFTAGTVMPSLGNPGWVTIWQFDENQSKDA